MIRQTEHEIKDVISKLTVGDKFTLYSETAARNNKQYRIISYEGDKVRVKNLNTLKICGTFENIQILRCHLLYSYYGGSICSCVINDDTINQMSLSAFKAELSKLDYNTLLHLYTLDNKEKIYKLEYVEPVSGYDDPYNVCLVEIERPTDLSIRAKTLLQLIDYICKLFEQDTYCSCKVEIINESLDNNGHSNSSSLIHITNEDKVDLINYNSYIKLTDYDNREYEYVVGTYASEYTGLYGVGNTTFNPYYENLDTLKRQLKADIRSGKYTNIEVVRSLEEPFALSENCTTYNSTTLESSNSDLYYPYKRYEIIQHKDYGIGIVNDNTFTFNNSRISASCKFWNSFKWKYLNKYCTQKNISIYYPNITEITKQKLDCFIIFKNVKTFKYLLKYLPAPYLTKEIKKSILNGRYKEQIEKKYNIPVIQIRQGEIIDIIYVNNKWFANIKCYDINMSDNTLIDTNTHKYGKEESKMKKIVVNQTTEKRVNKTNNTKYDVITTEVTVGNINGKVTLSAHDKDDTKMAIMYAICNAVVGGNFDTAYDKYLKHKQEEENPIADRTCSYCGMTFNTIQEREEHEKLEHIEKRKARHERYLIRKEAKRRLAEMEQEKLDAEREKAIEAKMKEMQKAEKKNK